MDKGAHRTVETVCAFTVLAHNAHIYWGGLGGAGLLSALCSVPPARGPRLRGQAGRKVASQAGL